MQMRYDWVKVATSIPDAVVVTVSQGEDGPRAEVEWPPSQMTTGGNYLYPTTVELALTRALDVRDHYGFARIVICIEDRALWQPQWGELATLPLKL